MTQAATRNRPEYEVFLGGQDLEMQVIGELARAAGVRVCDRGLRWGARASAYREELAAARAAGRIPLLVEMPWDLDEPLADAMLVDHHGERAGADQPSALRQIHQLLSLPDHSWSRWYDLVEANDIGWIPGMQTIGASAEEIRAIRAADRAAQGISAAEEQGAELALNSMQIAAAGRLAIIHSPHDRSAPITDRLHPALGGPAIDNLLIYGPNEIQFFGRGDIVQALSKQYPGGWYGGALPERGYWGRARGGNDDEARAAVVRMLE